MTTTPDHPTEVKEAMTTTDTRTEPQPAITFDAKAFRRRCLDTGEPISGDETYSNLDQDASQIVENVLLEDPAELHLADGVADLDIWRTADSEGPDGGGLVTVTVDGIDLACGHLIAEQLVPVEPDDSGRVFVPMVHAAVLATTAVVDLANEAVHRFRRGPRWDYQYSDDGGHTFRTVATGLTGEDVGAQKARISQLQDVPANVAYRFVPQH